VLASASPAFLIRLSALAQLVGIGTHARQPGGEAGLDARRRRS